MDKTFITACLGVQEREVCQTPGKDMALELSLAGTKLGWPAPDTILRPSPTHCPKGVLLQLLLNRYHKRGWVAGGP